MFALCVFTVSLKFSYFWPLLLLSPASIVFSYFHQWNASPSTPCNTWSFPYRSLPLKERQPSKFHFRVEESHTFRTKIFPSPTNNLSKSNLFCHVNDFKQISCNNLFWKFFKKPISHAPSMRWIVHKLENSITDDVHPDINFSSSNNVQPSLRHLQHEDKRRRLLLSHI